LLINGEIAVGVFLMVLFLLPVYIKQVMCLITTLTIDFSNLKLKQKNEGDAEFCMVTVEWMV